MKRYTDYDAFAWLYNMEWAFFGDNIFPALKTIAGDSLPDRLLDTILSPPLGHLSLAPHLSSSDGTILP